MSDGIFELVELFRSAVRMVYAEERPLLSLNSGHRMGLEQAFVFRTGIYLSRLLIETDSQFKGFDLDSEYNKNIDKPKRSPQFPKGIRPDLILHQRNSHDSNILVAEFKGWWNIHEINDMRKLEDLTSHAYGYQYLIGVFVHIGRTEATFRYFINGSAHE